MLKNKIVEVAEIFSRGYQAGLATSSTDLYHTVRGGGGGGVGIGNEIHTSMTSDRRIRQFLILANILFWSLRCATLHDEFSHFREPHRPLYLPFTPSPVFTPCFSPLYILYTIRYRSVRIRIRYTCVHSARFVLDDANKPMHKRTELDS